MSLSFGGSDSNSNSDFSKQGVQTKTGTAAYGPVNSAQIGTALNTAQDLYENGNPTINGGLLNVNKAADAATQAYGAGNGLLTDTLNGTYLSAGNPYFQGVVDRIGRAIRPQIEGEFAGAGRTGSGAESQAFASALADAVAPLEYQNYAAERQAQEGALGLIPSYTSGALNDATAQLQAGYIPINQYISSLAAVSPGTTGNYSSRVAQNESGRGNQSGSSSQFGASGRLAGGGGGGK